LAAGHRPGFLRLDRASAFADAAEQAYRDMCARLDVKSRKRPDPDDDEEPEGERQLSETARRELAARRAARQVLPEGERDAQVTLDQARAAADAAWEARNERMRNAWRSHHA
jgi:hypothetical protein